MWWSIQNSSFPNKALPSLPLQLVLCCVGVSLVCSSLFWGCYIPNRTGAFRALCWVEQKSTNYKQIYIFLLSGWSCKWEQSSVKIVEFDPWPLQNYRAFQANDTKPGIYYRGQMFAETSTGDSLGSLVGQIILLTGCQFWVHNKCDPVSYSMTEQFAQL